MKLYVVADRGIFSTDREWLDRLGRVARAIADQPVVRLQVRTKMAAPARRASLAARAREVIVASGGEALLDRTLLNGTTSDAIAAGYRGAHWPEVAIPAEPEARAGQLAVGASVHSSAALRAAEAAGAWFVLFGPVFDPRSKAGRGVGLEALCGVANRARVPVVAIGGITPARVASCLSAGAAGVAVVTGVLRAPDPDRTIAEYLAGSASPEGQER